MLVNPLYLIFPLLDRMGPGVWMALASGVIWGLVLCFLGYLLYRIEIVFGGLQGGVCLGVLLVDHYFAKPAGVDYFVTCMCLALLFSMVAWFLHRLVFSATILAMTAGVMLMMGRLGAEAWVYIVVGFVGLVTAILVFFFLKQIFIFVGSIVGAFVAVQASACLILSKTPRDAQEFTLGSGHWTLTIIVIVLTIGLTVAGMISQFKLSHLVRTRLVPEASKGGSPFVGGKMSKARLPVGK